VFGLSQHLPYSISLFLLTKILIIIKLIIIKAEFIYQRYGMPMLTPFAKMI
jgi:hypothetical protein